MFDWDAFTLILYITMRMSGFVLFSSIFGRTGVPRLFQGGFIGMLTLMVYSIYEGTVPFPATIIELSLRMLLEFFFGVALSFVMRFFFVIPEQAGEIIDTQMGMSMARSYDPGSSTNMTTTANILNMLMLILFFQANGHVTLLRMMMTSGEIVPFGAAALGEQAASRLLELFAEAILLSVKLSFPILGAELLGQVGMGVLMKAIPQINVFAINIELKILIGLILVMLLMSPISSFLLEAESVMLGEMESILSLSAA